MSEHPAMAQPGRSIYKICYINIWLKAWCTHVIVWNVLSRLWGLVVSVLCHSYPEFMGLHKLLHLTMAFHQLR